MNKDILIAIGAGSLSAVAALTFQTGAPGGLLFAYFAPLPLMLVGLSLGAMSGTISAIAGIVTAALLGGLMASTLFAVLHAFPAWFVARQALLKSTAPDGTETWYPLGNAISLLAVMAAFMFSMVALAESQSAESLQQALSQRLDRSIGLWFPTLPEAQRATFVAIFTAILPALIATSWLLMTIVNGVIAQTILVKIGKNLRPRPVYSALTLPDWLSWAIVAAACLALLGSGKIEYMGRTLVVILAIPFFILGLAVVHRLARHVAFPGLLLAAVYFSIFLSLWAAFVVVVVGISEQWLGLRKRLPNQGQNQESE
jgi:hypothetical protein